LHELRPGLSKFAIHSFAPDLNDDHQPSPTIITARVICHIDRPDARRRQLPNHDIQQVSLFADG
jgi:hypothetical protein